MNCKRDIFTFNHIDKSIDEAKLLEIKDFYRFYHKKWWCYKQTYNHLKRMNLAFKILSSSLIASGAIADGVTLNPIILGTISGMGLLMKTVTDHKNYNKKIEMNN